MRNWRDWRRGEGEQEGPEEGRRCIIVYLVFVFVRTLFIVVGHVVSYRIALSLSLVVCQSPIPSLIYAHAHILVPATFTIFLIHSPTLLLTRSLTVTLLPLLNGTYTYHHLRFTLRTFFFLRFVSFRFFHFLFFFSCVFCLRSCSFFVFLSLSLV